MQMLLILCALVLIITSLASAFHTYMVNYVDGKNSKLIILDLILAGIAMLFANFAFSFGLYSSNLNDALLLPEFIEPSQLQRVIKTAAEATTQSRIFFIVAALSFLSYFILLKKIQSDPVTYKANPTWNLKKKFDL